MPEKNSFEGRADGREDKRLDRIEAKIDRLSEIVISLARAEEKLISLESNQESNHNLVNIRLNKHADRIDSIETRIYDTSMTVKVINKLFWIVVAGAVTAVTATFFLQ